MNVSGWHGQAQRRHAVPWQNVWFSQQHAGAFGLGMPPVFSPFSVVHLERV